MHVRKNASILKWMLWAIEAGAWYFMLGLFWVLPIETASNVGGWCLRKIGPRLKAHQTALRNIHLVFPKIKDEAAEQLAMDCWDNLGRIGGEFAHLHKLQPGGERVEICGQQHLDAIIHSQKPAVLISGHFANWEVMAGAICLGGLPARVSYRPANNPWIDASITRIRLKYGIPELSAKGGTGAKEMLSAMAAGQSVTFLTDQKFNAGISTMFFGHHVMSAPGPARLAHRFGIPILPVSIVRLPGVRFRVSFHAPIIPDRHFDKTKAIANTVVQINQFLEARITEHPQSWFWVHKRWPKEQYGPYGPGATSGNDR